MKKVIITGGAGFIGSHLVDRLIQKGYKVTVFDILEAQVHGNTNKPPDYLDPRATFIHGSVTDYEHFYEVIKGQEVIYHLAAMVGVGQSMYQIEKYLTHNVQGTANLLDILVNKEHDIEKVIVGSSNTVYGEGKAYCEECGVIYPDLRGEEQLKNKEWELHCPNCHGTIEPLPTDEKKPFNSSSIYALSKQMQEESAQMIGKTYGINTTILRFFLVYGPRQSLSNPYTGVCGIFSNRLFSGKPPLVFEDGLQTRDFVNVKDVCQALELAMVKKESEGEIYNVASGYPITIKEVAEIITNKINPKLQPVYNQQYRVGDIRHCQADISKIQDELGYRPQFRFKEGIEQFIEWIKPQATQLQKDDASQKALNELKDKGLIK